MTTPLFPIVEAIPVKTVPPPDKFYPYFIIGCWQGYWQVHKGLYEAANCDSILGELVRLEKNGWAHLTICKLPP